MEQVTIGLAANAYDILIEGGIFQKLSEYVTGQEWLVITDQHVHDLYGQQLKEILSQTEWYEYVLLPGEESKTFEKSADILNFMLEHHLTRKGKVLAFGGGVVGDIAGFCASVYMRGVDFYQLPTTLLAQVDSSVGGKTAVNMPAGKNLVGSFYQPRRVFIDPFFLKTLPLKQVISGLGEIVKYGIIMNENFMTYLENNLDGLLHLDKELIVQVISQCCQMKAAITLEDEKESNKRKILNFGHTIGHSLEAATHYEIYAHGEAVLIGMGIEAAMSFLLGQITEAYFRRIQSLICRFPLPADSLPDAALLMHHMASDKKNVGKQISVMLPVSEGEVKEFLFDQAELKALLVKAEGVFFHEFHQ